MTEVSPRVRLHRLLKERDVDYWCAQGITFWNCDDGRECLAYTFESDGVDKLAMKVLPVSPEQAIAATVGAVDAGRGHVRPCPFCGGEATVPPVDRVEGMNSVHYLERPYYQVVCRDGCGCVMGDFDTSVEARDAWNRRAQ